jgi:hypothetical protein
MLRPADDEAFAVGQATQPVAADGDPSRFAQMRPQACDAPNREDVSEGERPLVQRTP